MEEEVEYKVEAMVVAAMEDVETDIEVVALEGAMEAPNACHKIRGMDNKLSEAEVATADTEHTLRQRKKVRSTLKKKKKGETGPSRRSALQTMAPRARATPSSPIEDRKKGGGVSV